MPHWRWRQTSSPTRNWRQTSLLCVAKRRDKAVRVNRSFDGPPEQRHSVPLLPLATRTGQMSAIRPTARYGASRSHEPLAHQSLPVARRERRTVPNGKFWVECSLKAARRSNLVDWGQACVDFNTGDDQIGVRGHGCGDDVIVSASLATTRGTLAGITSAREVGPLGQRCRRHWACARTGSEVERGARPFGDISAKGSHQVSRSRRCMPPSSWPAASGRPKRISCQDRPSVRPASIAW